jgi:hypothetical protein
MAVKIALSHKTTYTFDRSVKLFPCFLGFVHSRTAIEGYTFKISPENHFINWQQDPFEIIKPVSSFQTKLKS